MSRRTFYIYILASESRELYVGITNNLIRRVAEHREGADPYRYVFRHATARLVHVNFNTVQGTEQLLA